MPKKFEHKHTYVECLITYHYKTTVSHDPFEITRHERYCTKCGKIDHKRFEEDVVRKRISGTDRFGFSILSKDELLEKYRELPKFDVDGDSKITKLEV